MQFKINNRNWEIKEADSEWLLEEFKKENDNVVYCFGLTKYAKQTIYINEELIEQCKRQTLYHELMHCYLWSYASNFNEVDEETMCDISANSHDIIHQIVDEYFKEK